MKLQFNTNKKTDQLKTLVNPEGKWLYNKMISIILLLLFISVVVASSIILYNNYDVKYNTDDVINRTGRDVKELIRNKLQCSMIDCRIDCNDIDEDVMTVEQHINEVLINNNCTEIDMLEIKYSKFKEHQLNNNWLLNVTPNIQQLRIEKCDISNINERAFAGHPFNKLRFLRIVDINVRILQKQSFLGLDALTNFAFCRTQHFPKLQMEKNVLEGMSSIVQVIELSGFELNPEDIINFTGGGASPLLQLKTLVLSYSMIENLGEYSFINAPKVRQLHLEQINLNTIHQSTFWGGNNMKLLNLKGNALETIPDDAFRDLKRLKRAGMNLSNNKWRCNCSLNWLKEYYSDTYYIDKVTPPLCFNPQGEDRTFEETEFCFNGTTPFPSTTEIATTAIVPNDLVKINCTDQGEPEYKNLKIDTIHIAEVITIKNESVIIELQEMDVDPLQVVLKTKEDLSQYSLLWFNAENKSETDCVKLVRDNIILKNLKRGTNYGFSLLYKNRTEVSPASTFCLQTDLEWNLRSWITNKHKIGIIVLLLVLEVVIICVTVFLTILGVRLHPSIIASNKRVIILKSKKLTEHHITALDYDKPFYTETVAPPSTNGYLTPKYNRYMKVRYRPRLMRSISEYSLASNYYADPKQLKLLGKPVNREKLVLDSDVDHPPPLPPPNPVPKNTIQRQNSCSKRTCV